jgi:predicted alpha/beta hydrolase
MHDAPHPWFVESREGRPIAARVFEPLGAPRAIVVVAGGTAIPQRFYAPFAQRLSSFGHRVITFDYAGIGDARRTPAPNGLRGWARDAEDVLGAAHAAGGGRPLVYVGHSFGGQALGLMPSADERLSGAVLVAAQSGWFGHWDRLGRLRMELLFRAAVPALVGAFGRLPGWAGLGEDLPGPVAMEWARWCTTKGYLAGVVPARERHFARFSRPVLSFAFTDDDYAPGRSVDELLSWFRTAPVELRRRAPERLGVRSVGHFGFFRPAMVELWTECADWIERVTAAPPVALSA